MASIKLPRSQWLPPDAFDSLESMVTTLHASTPALAFDLLVRSLDSAYSQHTLRQRMENTEERREERSSWDEERRSWDKDRHSWEMDRVRWEADRSIWDKERSNWETVRTAWTEERTRLQRTLRAKDDLLQNLRRTLRRVNRSSYREPTTMSRVAAWRRIEPRVRKDVSLPSASKILVNSDDLAPVLTATYTKEKEYYPGMVKLVASVLREHKPDCKVVDTSANDYLDGCKPDITITGGRWTRVVSPYVNTFIEMKLRGQKLDGDAFGQVWEYAQRLERAQPHRKRFSVLLSNVDENIWFTVQDNGGLEPVISMSKPVGLGEALTYLVRVLRQPEQEPLNPHFSPALGSLENHLGATVKSVVAQFKLPPRDVDDLVWDDVDDPDGATTPTKPTAVAVKIGLRDNLGHEIDILRIISRAADRCPSLPLLLFHSPEETEYGFLPVGENIDHEQMSCDLKMAVDVIQDVHAALVWLHQHQLVHRDVRWANVVLRESRGVLIDLGCATAIDVPDQHFSGGFLCCPRELLGQDLREDNGEPVTYTPRASHDWEAFVLLVNAHLFPQAFRGFVSARVEHADSEETTRLVELWERLTASPVWRPYVKAVDAADGVATLQRMPADLIATLPLEELTHITDFEFDMLSLRENSSSVSQWMAMLPEPDEAALRKGIETMGLT